MEGKLDEVLATLDLIASDRSLPQTLFLIPIHSSPIYPGMIAPVVLTRPKVIETIENAVSNRGVVGLVLANEKPDDDTAPRFGTAVKILKRLNTTDGAITLLVHSLKRFSVKKIVRDDPYKVAEVEYKEEILEKSLELDALVRSVISQVKILSEHNPLLTDELKLAMMNASGPGAMADLVAFALSLKREDSEDFLQTISVKERFEKLLIYLKKEQQLAEIQRKIHDDINKRVHGVQREFILREQLRSIRKELGGSEDGLTTVEKYRELLKNTKLSLEAEKVANEEIGKLEIISETSPEHHVVRNYLDFMFALPWGKNDPDGFNIPQARKILDEDHHGIEKVKERILEFLAVRKLNPNAKSSILCLVGPPGVGKTSLGKSIARAMGRKYHRISLGGARDEADIKGHRKTYVGAMPGKILSGLKRAGSQNPVMVLDEVDKLGSSYHGDPASALLEALDSEQNNSFVDHYLDVSFDLSQVSFIVTANQTGTIPAPLLDRMEVIELNGYTFDEKFAIATKHIVPQELMRHGLKSTQLNFTEPALRQIILDYCREPGMRSLQQKIAAICRKVATKVVENQKQKKVIVKPSDLYKFLGPERFREDLRRKKTLQPGVVFGLAWTPTGGELLSIEAGDVPRMPQNLKQDSQFSALKLTGQLGDVMSESANIALSYVKKKTRNIKRAQEFFNLNDIHVHVPAGAIPKDGPSAGITMATALYSLVTGKSAKGSIAMTGELSLMGKVLPVGGIRDKILAASRSGITKIILPKANEKDLKEIPKENLKGLQFSFVHKVDDVFKVALK